MSTQTAITNHKRRRFQSTGFGLDRDVSSGDSLPIWKQKMFDRIKNRSKQNRQKLLQKLEQQKRHHQNLSPNSKKRNAHHTIDSFKNALIEHEMKHEFNQNNVNHASPNNSHNPSFYQAKDLESAHLTPEQYKVIFAELATYLEETGLSDLRESYVAALEEEVKDQEMSLFEELMANDAVHNPHIVYCPICCKNAMDIEYINTKGPVYSCLCGVKFQARDHTVGIHRRVNNMGIDEDDDVDVGTGIRCESDVDVAQRMLKTLKLTLKSLLSYHSGQLKCNAGLNFAVIEENGYLQGWCSKCTCNEIVI